ncbi:PP2C family protein-serine/threonine phosphatase [Anaeromicropila populeti]|uniref:Serine/threonine protein phosphatase PrpC n=1 Tax=Anaeromicropila populeti TaxID=37658 RepID=A0A1I6IQK2_9FIRM|nr:protein phosphatase 2C domain-containing protein [Anaeromicropila populeti]SFR69022.1 Serine/threonine protein phosphatase PrpC [Anaeromicropila populeti]
MKFLAAAQTDKGIVKDKNQDSLSIKIADTSFGEILLAVICDGMGGLEQGEVASATVIRAFENWFTTVLPNHLRRGISEDKIRFQWEEMLSELNEKIKNYGRRCNIRLGTTITALLIMGEKYYVIHVGDTRLYEIENQLRVLTRDQTVVAMEIARGRLTEEQAKVDPRRSILLQCVGASESVCPEFYSGVVKRNAVYMLCSDGFRHEITQEEIFECLSPDVLTSVENMEHYADYLIELNKSRKERDNISIALIKTY